MIHPCCYVVMVGVRSKYNNTIVTVEYMVDGWWDGGMVVGPSFYTSSRIESWDPGPGCSHFVLSTESCM
jgi:hypothetical protein